MIEFNHVSKQYGENAGLHDVSITIEEGEFVFLVGPSGAGKSTLIKLLLKEKEPDEGSIFFDGEEVTDMPNRLVPLYRRKIGIVFQDFRLLRKKTVYENVAFAMEAVHRRKKLIDRQVPHLLKLVGISEKADRYPDELSGGEAQRVAIARAMVNNPKALIADEPTGNLDPEKAWEIMNLLNQINIRGTTILMVTHAKDIVDRMGKRVVQLEGGRVVRDDRTGLYIENPLAVSGESPAEQETQYTPARERQGRQKSSGERIPAAAVMEKKPRPGRSAGKAGKKASIRVSEPVPEESRDTAYAPAVSTVRQSAATGQSPTVRRPSGNGASRRTAGVSSSASRKAARPEGDTWVEIIEEPVSEYQEFYDTGEGEVPVTRASSRRTSGGNGRSRREAGTSTSSTRKAARPEGDTWVEVIEEPVSEYQEYYDSAGEEAPYTREERYRRNVQRRMRSRQVQREEKRRRVDDMFTQADEMNYWDGGDMFD